MDMQGIPYEKDKIWMHEMHIKSTNITMEQNFRITNQNHKSKSWTRVENLLKMCTIKKKQLGNFNYALLQIGRRVVTWSKLICIIFLLMEGWL